MQLDYPRIQPTFDQLSARTPRPSTQPRPAAQWDDVPADHAQSRGRPRRQNRHDAGEEEIADQEDHADDRDSHERETNDREAVRRPNEMLFVAEPEEDPVIRRRGDQQ